MMCHGHTSRSPSQPQAKTDEKIRSRGRRRSVGAHVRTGVQRTSPARQPAREPQILVLAAVSAGCDSRDTVPLDDVARYTGTIFKMRTHGRPSHAPRP